jgi:CheY-like chemotaxis protein
VAIEDSGTFPRGSGLFAKKKVALAGPPAGLLRGAAGTLETAGYSVVAAERLEDLLRIPAEKVPDLAIMDVGFPPDGGVAACRRLREEKHWRTVSMMLVVPAGEAHLEEALVPGVNDFMLAPFPPDELLDKTKRLTLIPARRELNTLARVREARADGTVLLGKMLNVSGNGMLVEIESAIAIGRIVEIEFFLPDDPTPLNAKGRIMRRTTELDHFHPAFGVRFTEISEKDQLRVDAFVTERERAGYRR